MWLYLRIMDEWHWAHRRSLAKMRTRVIDPQKREKLNKDFNTLQPKSLRLFHQLYAKIFSNADHPVPEGEWNVFFNDKKIKLPLRKEKAWLDWDIAVSVTGHDPDIKETYKSLINSGAVKLFFDVGANYGTHSLLFLVNGINTISFEPNETLKKEFELYCSMNGVKGKMELMAMGERNDTVKFWFNPHETWNGTIVDAVADKLKEGEGPVQLEVQLTTIDDYVSQNDLQPDLIKIDTEGNEIQVLNGSRKTIASLQPMIIFESNHFSERPALWKFFSSVGYEIYKLPYSPNKKNKLLDEQQFLKIWDTNYIAIPRKSPL